MKKIKTIVSMLMAVTVCILLPHCSTLTVSAAEPVTYTVKYVEQDNEWRFQVGTWDDQNPHRDLYYLHLDIKDGDVIVIDGDHPGFVLEVPVRLSNLTFQMDSAAVVTANSIDECYVLRDSVAAINGDVTNAYVYDDARCTFNNNVNTLQVLTPGADDTLLHGTVTVNGTVNHLIGKDSTQLHYEFYNFAAGKLVISEGDLETDPAYYSTTASSSNTQSAQNTSASADEYDDVPKTGESNVIFWLLGISAICFVGRYTLKKG